MPNDEAPLLASSTRLCYAPDEEVAFLGARRAASWLFEAQADSLGASHCEPKRPPDSLIERQAAFCQILEAQADFGSAERPFGALLAGGPLIKELLRS